MPSNIVQRPQRWDEPFSTDMSENKIDWVLSSSHFSEMRHENFPQTVGLRNIIKNDCRIRRFQKDELIVYAGAYLNSAYLIMSGKATLILSPGIDSKAWGHLKKKKPSALLSLKRWLMKNRFPEVRESVSTSQVKQVSKRANDKRIVIEDLDTLLAESGAEIVDLVSDDVFGESAVLGRNVMTNTVVAQSNMEVLEIRWQGLRDICKWEASFNSFIDMHYRQRGLYEHLLTVPLFKNIANEEIRVLAKTALFEVHGEFEWQRDFQQAAAKARSEKDFDQLIEAEPVISEEADYPDGLLLIRNGFARVSRRINHGHYTLGHLASGGMFGLYEVYTAWQSGKEKALTCSLRAVGYTDVIRIPTFWLEKNLFNEANKSIIDQELEQSMSYQNSSDAVQQPIDRKFTEFLVENRYINGTEAMMIDLERCVRCDDCVTACANAHDGNPRFNRHGNSFGRYMIANACMHCEDPVCMIGCPTGAIHRSEDGVVSINDSTCIGCSSCANNCPYDNIRMVPVRNNQGQLFTDEKSAPIVKATKCDLCSQTAGGPACERACPHDALVRINVKDVNNLAKWIER